MVMQISASHGAEPGSRAAGWNAYAGARHTPVPVLLMVNFATTARTIYLIIKQPFKKSNDR